ncbi:MAG: ABC transporter ATP-binding protein [Magnetococcales bacterium]|nr:ABC transporter ATP-binding protein [Magnetococcales bacterium]
MTVNAIDIVEVSKRFGPTTVLDRVNLLVQNGSFFGLVGGNGAGKTTLVKAVLNLNRPDQGTIHIQGIAAHEVAARNGIAYLPERFLPPGDLTGREFLTFMLRLHGVTPRLEIMAETLLSLDMNPDALRKPIRALSKGMTQKLGLASCLMSTKPIWILDEPTSGLDPLARALLKKELHKQRGKITLFINTHLLVDVAELCDAMAILHHGQLLFHGAPTECRTRFGGHSLEESYLYAVRPQSEPP